MAADYETLRRLWRQTAGPRSEFLGDTETTLVLADALAEHGFVKLAKDLTKAAKRFGAYWKQGYPYERIGTKQPTARAIISRVEKAIEEVRTKPRVWSGTKKTSAVIRYYHGIHPSPKDVEGPFPATEADFVDLDSIRAWWERVRGKKLGRISRKWRKEKGKIVLFPEGRFSWHSIVIEPGRSRLSVRAREIQEMVEPLRRAHYLYPAMYARRLSRAGFDRAKLESELRLQEIYQNSPLDEKYNLRRTTTGRMRR